MSANNSPSVLLRRDPWVEALVVTTKSGLPPPSCHFCGKRFQQEGKGPLFPWSPKWTVFLTLIKGRDGGSPLVPCGTCLPLLQSVWDLEERITEWNLYFDLAFKKVQGLIEKTEIVQQFDITEIKTEGDYILPSGLSDLEDFVENCEDESFFDEHPAPTDTGFQGNESPDVVECESSDFKIRRRSARKRKVKKLTSSSLNECEESNESEWDKSDISEDDNNSEEDSATPYQSDQKIVNSCSKCGKTFSRKKVRVYHEVYICGVVYDKDDIKRNDCRLFRCDKCSYTNYDVGQVHVHYQTHGGGFGLGLFFTCSKCPSSFPSEAEMKDHLANTGHKGYKRQRKVDQELSNRFRTSLSKIFGISSPYLTINSSDLNAIRPESSKKDKSPDLNAIRPESSKKDQKGHACQKCGKTFASKDSKNRHEMHVCLVEGNIKPRKSWKCDSCPSFFDEKHRLLSHYFTHSGIKPFGCWECDQRFKVKGSLRKHLQNSGHSSGYRREILSKESLEAPKERLVI